MTSRRIGSLCATITNLKRKVNTLTRSCSYYQRRVEILETLLSDLDISRIPPRGISQQERFFEQYIEEYARETEDGRDQEGAKTLQASLFQEMDSNAQLQPAARRWSMSTCIVCYLWYVQGRKAYSYLRNVITLPSIQTLQRKFEKTVQAWRISLTELSHVPQICDLFRRRHQIGETARVDVGIGIDALAMETVTDNQSLDGVKFGDNNVFAFVLLPINPDYKPIVLHLLPHHSGNSNIVVHRTCKWIQQCLRLLHFNVRFAATDGDAGYNPMNEELFRSWWPVFCNTGLEAAVEVLNSVSCDLMISDFLHLLKNARSRMLNGAVTINAQGLGPFTSTMMNNVLHLGDALTDKSVLGKMKDIYPLQIFTLENFKQLIEVGEFCMAFYVLPYAMWMAAVRDPALSQQTRLDLLALTIESFAYHEECLNNLDNTLVSERKTKDAKPQYICEKVKCHRMLNTLLVLIRELRTFRKIGLDRVGTHVVECMFGIIRILCQHKHSWKRIRNSFANLLLVTDLSLIIGYPIVPRSRLNDGGVKLNDDSTDLIYIKAPEVSMREILESVNMIIARRAGSETFTRELLQEMVPCVASFLHYIYELLAAHNETQTSGSRLWQGSPISNATILSRLIAFTKGNHIQGNEQDPENCSVCEEIVGGVIEENQFQQIFTPENECS